MLTVSVVVVFPLLQRSRDELSWTDSSAVESVCSLHEFWVLISDPRTKKREGVSQSVYVSIWFSIKFLPWAGERTQWEKKLVAKADDLSSIPGTHTVGEEKQREEKQLPPLFFDSTSLLCPVHYTCAHMHTDIHTHTLSKFNF